ncbi:MAG: hypothetical protein VXY00_06265 [Candidatus Latescibacterota bacterium]|nr:hypothetical protein [Candidatus Latescibacterota bacterium]MEC8646561.1 hypothetical protein [Candidatus Latescibacterota bacterium]MEE2628320.1 hypothetical protein [Candidatus Latescibacterota bacterium]MEE2728774.1 hypothetical protein [Candidatus Latescibacterota bacterium]
MTYFFMLMPFVGLVAAFLFAVRTPPASKSNQSDDRAFSLADHSG